MLGTTYVCQDLVFCTWPLDRRTQIADRGQSTYPPTSRLLVTGG